MEFAIFMVIVLLFTNVGFWSSWRDAKLRKEELEEAVYWADEQTGFIDKVEPAHFVLPRHFGAILGGEEVSPYEDCVRYYLLTEVKFERSLKKTKRATSRYDGQ